MYPRSNHSKLRSIIRGQLISLMTEAVADVSSTSACLKVPAGTTNSDPLYAYKISYKQFGKTITWADELDFCGFVPAKNYPGKGPNSVIFRLNASKSKNLTMAEAFDLGAVPIPDEYFNSPSPFLDELRKEFSDQKSYERQVEISKIKNDEELSKSIPYNSSSTFYVFIDDVLKNEYVVSRGHKQVAEVAGNNLLAYIMKDPRGGYGKFIKSMPPKEREAFVKALTGLSGLLGILSIPAITGPVAPVAAAANIGPSLALASIAWSEDDELSAALYFFGSFVAAYAAWKEFLSGIKALNQIGKAAGFSQTAIEELSGGALTTLGRVKQLLSRITRDIANAPSLTSGWQQIADAADPSIVKYIFSTKSGPLKSSSGEILQFTLEEMNFIKRLAEPAGGAVRSAVLYKSLLSLVEGLSGAFMMVFGISLESLGILFDGISIYDAVFDDVVPVPAEALPAADMSPEAQSRAMVQEIDEFTYKLKSINKKYVEVDKYGNILVKWDSLGTPNDGSMLLINKSTLETRVVPSFAIRPENVWTIAGKLNRSITPQFLVVSDAIYDVFDQFSKFPASMFKPSNKYFVVSTAGFAGARATSVFLFSNI